MAFLRSSRNYVWNINNVLGKGATGAVYSGVNKHTGDPVAVKSFNHASHMRPYEVQEREFEVLKKVNHQNIVKLIAIEEENESHHKVLIMELCTGGSLFNILDDPTNFYGLQEKEFTAVLKHLAAGMKHLRDNNIIHRDLKPGNIMKYIGEDGISIYKLTDFGAARVLEDDQPFMSLYGTEEYLHPDMYARAVLHKSAGKSFRANVDLWSIGVTLYHIATGSLPFKPYGGRKNKETMFKITTEKKSGIIAGYQEFENGEINWSDHLPKTCLLSPALQDLIVPLLAGIMECDSYRMWSFDKFFTTVTHVLSHKVVYIFYVNHMEDVVVYLRPNEYTVNDLKHYLELKLSIPFGSILLLCNKELVTDLSQTPYTSENPILLLNSDVTKLKLTPFHLSLPKLTEIHKTPTNCEADAQISKSCASVAYAYRRVVSKCITYYNLASSTPSNVISLLFTNLQLFKEKNQACSHFFSSLKNQLDNFKDADTYLKRVLKLVDCDERLITDFESLNRANLLFKEIFQYSNERLPSIKVVADSIKNLQDKTNESPIQPFEKEMEVANARAKHYCQKIRESWQFLHKDKTSRGLAMAEDQLHQLEKIKIDNNSSKLSNLVQNICFPSLIEITKKLEAWYSEAQILLKDFDVYFKNLSQFMEKCEQLEKSLEEVRNYQKATWQTAIRKGELKYKDGPPGPHSKSDVSASQNGSSHLDIIKSVVEYEERRSRFLSLMEENQSLVNEFDSLSTRSPQE